MSVSLALYSRSTLRNHIIQLLYKMGYKHHNKQQQANNTETLHVSIKGKVQKYLCQRLNEDQFLAND